MTEVVVEYDPFTSAAGTSSSSASSIIIDHFGISCHRRPLVGTSRFQFGLNAKTWPSLNDVCSIDVMRTPPFGPSISLSRRRNEASSRCKNYRLFLSFLCVPGALGTAPSLIHNCFSTRQGFEKKKKKSGDGESIIFWLPVSIEVKAVCGPCWPRDFNVENVFTSAHLCLIVRCIRRFVCHIQPKCGGQKTRKILLFLCR